MRFSEAFVGTVRYRVRQPLIMHTDSSGHKIIEQYLHVYTDMILAFFTHQLSPPLSAVQLPEKMIRGTVLPAVSREQHNHALHVRDPINK